MAQPQIKSDFSKLEILKKNLANIPKVKVGILNDKPRKGSESNATIGLKHEFGEGVPARSWLRQPVISPPMANAVVKLAKKIQRDVIKPDGMTKFMEAVGSETVDVIRQGFESSGWGTWQPNSPETIALKGSSKPLIDTGQLSQSISFELVGR